MPTATMMKCGTFGGGMLASHHHSFKSCCLRVPTTTAWNALLTSSSSQLFTNVHNNQINIHQGVRHNSRLVEVGKLQTPKGQGKYEGGQLFLHKVFGYRGVVLFPWLAKVYDRDEAVKNLDGNKSVEYPTSVNNRDVKGKTHTYYQTLIDLRDCPHIKAQTESVTFLGMPDSSGTLMAIPGLDYVAHDDVLPYSTKDSCPIQNELFEKFLYCDENSEPQWVPAETLRSWQNQNHHWLELSEVHRQTTNDVRITVIPFYVGARESHNNQVYWWRYCIRLENLGKEKLQLRERHWRIFSLSGTLETVRGRGVVGKEPILTPKEPAFQYSSHVSLQAASGHMWGTFKIEREDGSSFECKIPPFSLESKIEE